MLRPVLGSVAYATAGCLALAAVFVVAFGSHRGFDFDARAFDARAATHDRPNVQRVGEEILNTISVSSLALLGVTAIAMALLWRGRASAFAIVMLVAGANVTTQVLKLAFAEPDPFGRHLTREIPGAFPSGHATVAMSLALAFVLASPSFLRGFAALGGAAYALAVGVMLVLLGSHYPSDVAGGYLVAAAWAGCATASAALLGPLTGRRIRPRPRPTFSAGMLAAFLLGPASLFAAIAAFAIYRHPDAFTRGALSSEFIAACAALAAIAGCIVSAALGLARGTRGRLLDARPSERSVG